LKEAKAVPKTNELHSWIQTSSVADYVLKRQNADGGYTFAQWSESSAQDTYFALKILKMLGVNPVHKERTISFLRRMQHTNGSFDSINVAYYVTKSLRELGSEPQRDVRPFVRSLRKNDGGFGSLDANIEASSELEATYLSLELLRLLDESVQSTQTINSILKLKNPDGSFGRSGYSTLASINYALASLRLLGFNLNSLEDTAHWLHACEIPTGGFAARPNRGDPYLVIDELYHAVKALRSLGKACQYPYEHLRLIGRFQNRNGGFRRSVFLGISTFEQTYYALASLESLSDLIRSTSSSGRSSLPIEFASSFRALGFELRAQINSNFLISGDRYGMRR
jgi:hypothetical protein